MINNELIPHLFRQEYGKMTAVLCHQFGLDQIGLAEDIVSDTFSDALESWPHRGIPANPTAWLYRVAKNKTINILKKRQSQLNYDNQQVADFSKIEFSEELIADSQLRMIFAVCHPALPNEARIALALKVLCGFGIEEIANAFLTSKDVINKRLYRAKKYLRAHQTDLDTIDQYDIKRRMDSVLTTIYLLFNEGYYSESNDSIIRKDLCLEALRLGYILSTNEETSSNEVNALVALICFHSSRLEARMGACGQVVLYNDQDSELWDHDLIAKGVDYLNRSSNGDSISKYHLEANIAYWHTVKEDSEEKWKYILTMYDLLLLKEKSSVAALNRTYAVYKLGGEEAAAKDAYKLNLYQNQYYYVLLAELHLQKDKQKSMNYLETAYDLAKTEPEKNLIHSKISQLAYAC